MSALDLLIYIAELLLLGATYGPVVITLAGSFAGLRTAWGRRGFFSRVEWQTVVLFGFPCIYATSMVAQPGPLSAVEWACLSVQTGLSWWALSLLGAIRRGKVIVRQLNMPEDRRAWVQACLIMLFTSAVAIAHTIWKDSPKQPLWLVMDGVGLVLLLAFTARALGARPEKPRDGNIIAGGLWLLAGTSLVFAILDVHLW